MFEIGQKVKYNPQTNPDSSFFPPKGTIGTVIKSNAYNSLVEWPKGSVISDNLGNTRWFAPNEELVMVDVAEAVEDKVKNWVEIKQEEERTYITISSANQKKTVSEIIETYFSLKDNPGFNLEDIIMYAYYFGYDEGVRGVERR